MFLEIHFLLVEKLWFDLQCRTGRHEDIAILRATPQARLKIFREEERRKTFSNSFLASRVISWTVWQYWRLYSPPTPTLCTHSHTPLIAHAHSHTHSLKIPLCLTLSVCVCAQANRMEKYERGCVHGWLLSGEYVQWVQVCVCAFAFQFGIVFFCMNGLGYKYSIYTPYIIYSYLNYTPPISSLLESLFMRFTWSIPLQL